VQVGATLEFSPHHFFGDVISLPNRERNDRERRVLGRAVHKLAAIRDEQVADVVRLSVLIADTVAWARALPAGAHVVRRGERTPRIELPTRTP
jgi:hypothetical protein